jgi:hypothetical protein
MRLSPTYNGGPAAKSSCFLRGISPAHRRAGQRAKLITTLVASISNRLIAVRDRALILLASSALGAKSGVSISAATSSGTQKVGHFRKVVAGASAYSALGSAAFIGGRLNESTPGRFYLGNLVAYPPLQGGHLPLPQRLPLRQTPQNQRWLPQRDHE